MNSFLGGMMITCCSIPIDDEHTAQWYIHYDDKAPMDENCFIALRRNNLNPDYFNEPMGGWHNMWHQDRAAMKDGHWSGFAGKGLPHEDFAVQESMGPIVDRTQEHVGQCDHVIVRTRRMLIDAVRHYQQTGEVLFAGLDINYQRIRGNALHYPSHLDWRDFDAFNPSVFAGAAN